MNKITMGLLAAISMISFYVKAGETDDVIILCKGTAASGATVMLVAKLDPVDRITSLDIFSGGTGVTIDPKNLSSPSHFVRVNEKNELLVFGFKEFDDGLQEKRSVTFVKDVPALSKLALGYTNDEIATNDISCEVVSQ